MARHLIIHGRVQGVGYRESLRAEAARLGVTGWVRNRRDGTVEAMVDGAPAALDAILAWAHRGPPAAHVTRVEEAAAEGRFSGFVRLPTA
jgi:acylphosphatase